LRKTPPGPATKKREWDGVMTSFKLAGGVNSSGGITGTGKERRQKSHPQKNCADEGRKKRDGKRYRGGVVACWKQKVGLLSGRGENVRGSKGCGALQVKKRGW